MKNITLRISMRIFLQILLLLGSTVSVAAQQPTTGFVEPVIRIAVGSDVGTATATFKSTHAETSPPVLEDVALPLPAATV